MIKGRCRECDAAIQDTDELGGGMYTCPSCGHLAELPDAPEPDVPDELGVPMARPEALYVQPSPRGRPKDMPAFLKFGVILWTVLGLPMLGYGLYYVGGGVLLAGGSLLGLVGGMENAGLAFILGVVLFCIGAPALALGVARMQTSIGVFHRRIKYLRSEKLLAVLGLVVCGTPLVMGIYIGAYTLGFIAVMGVLFSGIIFLLVWLRYLSSDEVKAFFERRRQPIGAEGAELVNELVEHAQAHEEGTSLFGDAAKP
jgi:hypothetical protein